MNTVKTLNIHPAQTRTFKPSVIKVNLTNDEIAATTTSNPIRVISEKFLLANESSREKSSIDEISFSDVLVDSENTDQTSENNFESSKTIIECNR